MKSLSLTRPHLIVMVGVPGAGKSFFASQFANMFHAPIVSYDSIRAAVSSNQPLYGREEQSAVDSLASDQAHQLMLTSATIVIDGGSETRTARQEIVRRAKTNGYKTLFVWVQTDPATAKLRATGAIRGRQSELPPLSTDQYDAAIRRSTPPNDSEPFIVISGKHTFATQAKTILKKLSEPRAEQAGTTPPPTERQPSSGHRVIIR